MRKGNFFSTLMPQDYSFLNVAPHQKMTSEKAPEYLTFLFNFLPCPTDVSIKFVVTRLDQPNEVIPYEKLNLVAQNQTIEINASLSKVKQLTTIADDIYSYFVTIHEIKEDNTEKIIALSNHYYPDYNTQPEDEQVVIFRNQLGVWETQRFLGASTASQEISRKNFVNTNNEEITYHSDFYEKIILRTGNLEQSWLRYIGEELITSSEIYLIRDDMKIRLQCTTDSLVIQEDQNYEEFAEIEFRFAQTETN